MSSNTSGQGGDAGDDSLDFVSGVDFGDDSLPASSEERGDAFGDEEGDFGSRGGQNYPKGGGNMAGMGQMKFGEGTNCNYFVCQSTHPVAAVFHLLFKFAAVLVYLFCGWFSSNFVMIFVVCILLLAADFWAVKNVTGRLLVGLRWWNRIQEDGSNEWIYESHPDVSRRVPTIDKRIFWWSTYFCAAAWSLFAFVALVRLSLDWLVVCFVALALTVSNLIGYIKCSKEARRRVQQAINTGSTSMIPSIASSLGSGFVRAIPGLGSAMGFDSPTNEADGGHNQRQQKNSNKGDTGGDFDSAV
eukprot:gb/GECG01009791.1/.p1 GENE.gb/GECG01009791.1/~~gb/GECG01009791.1/.p1  ORF type:complete len:301 (+),score=33.13 gb/GECG01009791.1/:1-903(+)